MPASHFLWYYQNTTVAELLILTAAWAVVGLLVPLIIHPSNTDKE